MIRTFPRFAAWLLLTFVSASVVAVQRPPETLAVSESAIRAYIKFLSDDLLEGRGTGARGGEIAAKYIAMQLEALGLRGAAPGGSYFQPVQLFGVKADPATTLGFKGTSGSETMEFGKDFVAFTGAQSSQVALDNDMVFVGYGIEAPEQRWNDYKGDADEFRNKVLVMLVNDPPATPEEPNLFGGTALTYYGRWTYKFEEGARRGAAGVILLHTEQSAGYPWSVVRTSNSSWRYDLAREENEKIPYLKLRAWITDEAAVRLMRLAGLDLAKLRRNAASRDFRPVKLNVKTVIDLNSEVKKISAPNVAAILPGRDNVLRSQYVVFSAHWDHLGVGAPDAKGDTIYNGAVDNASGVAGVLAMAKALSESDEAHRPRRSILFLLPTAEEQGLLGSEWYVRYPLVPLAQTAADINLDSMNVLGLTRDFIPLGADRSSLQSVVKLVARTRDMQVKPDARPEQGSFYRSDHFPFARAGVPSINLEPGEEFIGRPAGWGEEQFRIYNTTQYHQPSDEYSDSWDLRGTVQESEVALAIGLEIANGDAMPRFNPGDEFSKAQLKR